MFHTSRGSYGAARCSRRRPLKYWMERLPHVAFTNLYGPTEATIASSYYTVPALPADAGRSVPIGKACGGEELLVLSENLQPLPPGEVGEIYIGGAGVTLGYWRDEEKTNRAFLQADAGRIYRTGDLGYWDEGGLVRFLGRADSQIKLRGHRIELGEIEASLHAVPEVGQGAIVAVGAAEFGGHVICCAYVPRAGVQATPRAIKERMTALVPKYMLPVRWRRMETLPANVQTDHPATHPAAGPCRQQRDEIAGGMRIARGDPLRIRRLRRVLRSPLWQRFGSGLSVTEAQRRTRGRSAQR